MRKVIISFIHDKKTYINLQKKIESFYDDSMDNRAIKWQKKSLIFFSIFIYNAYIHIYTYYSYILM